MDQPELYIASPQPHTPDEWLCAAQAVLVVACSEVEHLQVPLTSAIEDAAALIGHQAIARQLHELPPHTVDYLTRRSLRSVFGITGDESPEEIARLHNSGRLYFVA